MKTKIVCIAAIVVMLLSCNKTDESTQITGRYKSDDTSTLSSAVMYTKQGQVTNTNTIQDFYKKRIR